MANSKPSRAKSPKLVQSSLGLFSEMDKDVFGSAHDEIMCWTDRHTLEIVNKLWPDKESRRIISKKWEKPVTTTIKGQYRLIGFVDLVAVLSNRPERVYFEIKTHTRPGSDIRQIRAYEFYLSGIPDDTESLRGPFVVVSPEDQHADLFESQGIKFVKYPDFLASST